MLIQYGIHPILRNSKIIIFYTYPLTSFIPHTLVLLFFLYLSIARLSIKRTCIILTYTVQHNFLRAITSTLENFLKLIK